MSGNPSREAILSRIRAATGATAEADRRSEALHEWHMLPRGYRRKSTLGEEERVALFDERLRHYSGTSYYSNGNVAREIGQILSERGRRVLVVPPAFPSEWLPSGFMFISDEPLTNEQLNSSDGVVTKCALGIAITGTVVLESSPEQGRRAATLIPDYHLCVLRKQDIVELVPEAIRKLESAKSQPLTFFSGPSATVDIEMTRVQGVHGPRTLDVLIV